MRDYQKQKVYDWEKKFILPLPEAKAHVRLENAQMFVDGVWASLGLLGPPAVGLISKRATRRSAQGNRWGIDIRMVTPTWLILHELAHSLTCDHNGGTNKHGPEFVGMYMQLLEKVLKISAPYMYYTAKEKAGIDFNVAAKPSCGRM